MRDDNNSYEIDRQLDILADQYQAKVKAWGLPPVSADELPLVANLTPEQSRYVMDFIDQWDRTWERLGRGSIS